MPYPKAPFTAGTLKQILEGVPDDAVIFVTVRDRLYDTPEDHVIEAVVHISAERVRFDLKKVEK